MNISFNLVERPWIPTLDMQGRAAELGVRETLARAHELRSVQSASPLETATLHRLLLAVLHSALRGPRSQREWVELWRQGRWNMSVIDAYLEQWHNRFDLFHPQTPFYQVRQDRMALKPAALLTHGMATANELFEHGVATQDAILTPSQAARALLAAQCYGLGGLCHPQLGIHLITAPLTRGIVFLIEGDSLFQTLALNLLRYDRIDQIPITGDDRPAWEMEDPFKPARSQPLGYLDYLTWQNRKLSLIPEEADGQVIVRRYWIDRGLSLGEVLDPMKQYSRTEKGWKHLPFSEERALWRDSHSLFRLKSPDQNRPPLAIKELASHVGDLFDASQVYRCMALGAGVHYKDAKIFFYRQEHLPLPLAYFRDEHGDELVEQLANALDLTDQVRSKLWGAASALARGLLAPNHEAQNGRPADKNDIARLIEHWSVERTYWSLLESQFLRFVEEIPKQPAIALKKWQKALQRAAWQSLERAITFAGETPKALKAAVRARTILGSELRKLIPQTDQEEQNT